jgi:hypothetical protein
MLFLCPGTRMLTIYELHQIDKATCADVSGYGPPARTGRSDLFQTVYNAIKLGYRLIDGAADYGNEKEAGQGVRRAIDDGIIKREDICMFNTPRSLTNNILTLIVSVITTKARAYL